MRNTKERKSNLMGIIGLGNNNVDDHNRHCNKKYSYYIIKKTMHLLLTTM